MLWHLFMPFRRHTDEGGGPCNGGLCKHGAVAVLAIALLTPARATLAQSTLCDPVPKLGCGVAGKSVLSIRHDASSGRGNRLVWKWLRGATTAVTDLGDPVTGSTAYAFCLYDAVGEAPGLVMSIDVPAGAGWKHVGSRLLRYRDRAGAPSAILVRTGGSGRANVTVKARGANLPLPSAVSSTRLFDQDLLLVAQLVNSAGACWGTEFRAPAIRHDGERLMAIATPSNPPSTGRKLHIGTTGCNPSGPGGPTTPFCSVQAGADQLQPGDTLVIGPGTYRETLRVRTSGTPAAPILIRAAAGATPVIEGPCSSFPCPISQVLPDGFVDLIQVDRASYVTIRGLTVRKSAGYGIWVNAARAVTIEHVVVDGTVHGGIVVDSGSRDMRVIHNEVTHTNQGVQLADGSFRQGDDEAISFRNVDRFVIAYNYVHDVYEEGIDPKDASTHGEVRNNLVERACAVGFYLNQARFLRVSGNTVRDAGYYLSGSNRLACGDLPFVGPLFNGYFGTGFLLAVGDGTSGAPQTSDNEIFRNIVSHCHLDGLQFWDQLKQTGQRHGTMTNNRIYNNVFYNCGVAGLGQGMLIDDATGNVIANNIFALNAAGGIVGSTVDANTITHNLFYNTGQGAGTNQITSAPLFVDPVNGDFHLQAGSPAIDSGTDMGLPALGAGPDIGVFEQ